ncbi:MAG: hypothetical protein JRG74_14870, partial [Deltaproteobacteria bacterium]|nr:hypothetical protein [Deltaproteobacteria bacterium]
DGPKSVDDLYNRLADWMPLKLHITDPANASGMEASQSEQHKLKQCWEKAGLGPLPDAAAGE